MSEEPEVNGLCTTPHIQAKPEDFAKTVLMPGDPKRAGYIAQNFLENAVLVNDIRGVQGYTGTYNGRRVSVMASGMGMPSMGIYSYELFSFFGVENIIRVGSAGAISPSLGLRDIVFAVGASTDSGFASQFNVGTYSATATFSLLQKAVRTAEERGIKYTAGNIFSTDVFYTVDPDFETRLRKLGILCVEMETYALYTNAARTGKNALTVLTVSDILGGENNRLSPEERQSSFNTMIELALNISE